MGRNKNHAETCIIDEAVYMYIDPNLQQKSGVVFNVVGQVKGLLKGSQYFPINLLSDDEQKEAQKLVVSAFDQWEEVSKYNNENSLLECFPRTSEPTMIESPSRFNSWDPLLVNTCELPGISSYDICPSINCIGEPSQLGSPGQGICGPMYSPDFMPPYFGVDELVQFLKDHNQPERRSPELGPKSKWFMIRKRIGSLERFSLNKRLKIS